MELRHLRSFVAVAEELHFTRAAERLHMAQSPLSQQIRRMEAELGTRLFERDHHNVELTDAGHAMLEHARAALRHADDAARAARTAGSGRSGSLEVGFLATAALELLPRILPAFRARTPAAQLRLREAPTREQLDAVRERRLDVAFTRPPRPAFELRIETIWSEPVIAALPARHALAATPRLQLSDLAEEPLIVFPRSSAPDFYDRIIAACHDAGFSPDIVQEALAMPTIISLVASELGAALVPRSLHWLTHPDVAYRELEPAPLRAEIAMVSHATNHNPLLNTFTTSVRDALA